MIARLLGVVLVLVPVGMVIALFWYWLSRRDKKLNKKESEGK
jgi:preprotein translocase subunit YajC